MTTDSLDHTSVPRTAVAADRSAWLLLVAAISGSAALILWFGRDTSFSFDELSWVLDSPDFSLRDALEPYNGHLVLTSRLLYAGLLDVFGSDYLPYRLLAVGSVALLATLFFVYARTLIGSLAALAPTLVLLVFGSDAVHVLVGNGFTVLIALACGVGALIALRREDRAGDIAASGLLCVGVATYSVALAFVVGIGVMVLIGGDRRRRIWIAALPAALYAAWWLWALQIDTNSASQATLSNLLLLPAWTFQALGAALSALTGLDYNFAGSSDGGPTGAAAALALLALAALAFRLRRGSVPRMLWAAIAVFVALSGMNLLVEGANRQGPASPRYLFPATIAVLLIAVEAGAGHRWRRDGLIALFAVALAGAAANIALLRDSSAELRGGADALRAELTSIEVADGLVPPDFDPRQVDPQSPLIFPWATGVIDQSPNEAYLAATRRYESFGFDLDDLRGESEPIRARTDRFLVGILGIAPTPVDPAPVDGCRTIAASDGVVRTVVDPGSSAVIEVPSGPAPVGVRRFAETTDISLGELQPGRAVAVAFPADSAPDPWAVTVTAPSARICPR